MEIKQCMLTNNICYKQNIKINVKGILLHSTGAKNPELRRYVQPNDGLIGQNKYNNDWNRPGVSTCVNAFIGKDINGDVRCYQTLPWNVKPNGCGYGANGSFNNSHTQFEICEDGLNDEKYFNTAFDTAIDLCVYLCKLYGLDSSSIVSHAEAHELGYASDHGDPEYWLKKFGKSMNWFRGEVEKRLHIPVPAPTPASTTTTYYPQYNGNTTSIVDALVSIGVDSSMANRKQIAEINGITGYRGTAEQNEKLLSLLKRGKLVKVKGSVTVSNCYPQYKGKTISIVDALVSIGVDSSMANRKKIAAANGISGYKGTAEQNEKMLSLLKQGKLIKA